MSEATFLIKLLAFGITLFIALVIFAIIVLILHWTSKGEMDTGGF